MNGNWQFFNIHFGCFEYIWIDFLSWKLQGRFVGTVSKIDWKLTRSNCRENERNWIRFEEARRLVACHASRCVECICFSASEFCWFSRCRACAMLALEAHPRIWPGFIIYPIFIDYICPHQIMSFRLGNWLSKKYNIILHNLF